MLEIEYLGPRVAKIRNPRQTSLQSKATSDQMHRLRRAGTDNQIHGVRLQILLQKPDGRTYPKATGIGTEHIATDPHCHLLQKGLVLSVHRIDLNRFCTVA